MILKHENFANSQNSGFVGFASCQKNIQVKRWNPELSDYLFCFIYLYAIFYNCFNLSRKFVLT